MGNKLSPCMGCTRVKDPRDCENKNCQVWRRWFIGRWDRMRENIRAQMEQEPAPVGVTLGGKAYASPHQTEKYLQADPCESCLCPKDLCSQPCPLKRNWLAARKEVTL